MKPFWVLLPLSLEIGFSEMTFEQIERKRYGIGISTEGAGKLNGTVSIEKAASIGKNAVQFLTDCLFGMVSGYQEQMPERLKIPAPLILSFNFHEIIPSIRFNY